MRILLVTTAHHKEFGGPPRAVVGAAENLAKIGHNVEILVCGQSEQSISENVEYFDALDFSGVGIRVLKSRRTSRYGHIGTITENVETLRQIRRFDVISLHGLYNFQNLIVASFCLITKKPFTLMPHGSLTKYQRHVHFVRKIFVDPLFFGLVLRPAAGIFVATEVEKNEINRSIQFKTKVVGLGVTLPGKYSSGLTAKENREFFDFLFMGRIAPKKRLDIAIDAFAMLPDGISSNSRIIICGDGDPRYVALIKSRAMTLLHPDKFIFKGWTSGLEKAEVLSNSDCFLLTSEDENFAIAAAEALASGVPCILSTHVALAGIVRKYDAGIVFANLTAVDVANAMSQMIKANKIEIRERALQAGLELSWETVILNWERELRNVVGGDTS